MNDALEIDTVFAITGSTVSSTYMHSKYYIKNTLIPNYDILMAGVEKIQLNSISIKKINNFSSSC